MQKAYTGLGLGYHLMQRLIAACRARGVRELWGDVLAENHALDRARLSVDHVEILHLALRDDAPDQLGHIQGWRVLTRRCKSTFAVGAASGYCCARNRGVNPGGVIGRRPDAEFSLSYGGGKYDLRAVATHKRRHMLAAEETASRLPLVLIDDDSETAILYLRQLL